MSGCSLLGKETTGFSAVVHGWNAESENSEGQIREELSVSLSAGTGY